MTAINHRTECAYCGYEFDGHMSGSDREARPVTGDFCVCIDCAAISTVSSDGRLRKTTNEEKEEILRDEDSLRTILTVLRVNTARKAN